MKEMWNTFPKIFITAMQACYAHAHTHTHTLKWCSIILHFGGITYVLSVFQIINNSLIIITAK